MTNLLAGALALSLLVGGVANAQDMQGQQGGPPPQDQRGGYDNRGPGPDAGRDDHGWRRHHHHRVCQWRHHRRVCRWVG